VGDEFHTVDDGVAGYMIREGEATCMIMAKGWRNLASAQSDWAESERELA